MSNISLNQDVNVSISSEDYYIDAPCITADRGSFSKTNQEFKADAGKAMPDLLDVGFANALRLVQATLEYGDQKYEAHSWRHVPNALERYLRAGARHRQDRMRDMGGVPVTAGAVLFSTDDESGLPHIAHEIFNLMAIIELALQEEVDSGKGEFDAVDLTDALVSMMKSPPTAHKTAKV